MGFILTFHVLHKKINYHDKARKLQVAFENTIRASIKITNMRLKIRIFGDYSVRFLEFYLSLFDAVLIEVGLNVKSDCKTCFCFLIFLNRTVAIKTP